MFFIAVRLKPVSFDVLLTLKSGKEEEGGEEFW